MPRPSKPIISRRNATLAALELIDAHGLESLSVADVARKLGVRAPSLYYHFHNKSELLQEVARLVLVELPDITPAADTFEERIIAISVSTRRALLRHPHVAPLILRYFPRRMLVMAYERAAAQAPYPPAIQMTVLETLEKLTYGSSLFAAAAKVHGVGLLPPLASDRFPALAAAVAANPFDDEAMFIESLRIFLQGVRTRIAAGEMGLPLAPTAGAAGSGDAVGEDGRTDDGGAGAARQQADAGAGHRIG